MIILKPKLLVTVDVCYFIPQTSILNDFIWQVDDFVPDIPRVHKFLEYWRMNIEAKIKHVMISHSEDPIWRNVDHYDSIR